MKIEITLKDPDVLYDAIDYALEELQVSGVNEEEIEVIKKKRKESIMELCGKWFEYGEYLTVIVDTETESCVVKELE
ncbi:MAG: hypothetical protein AB1545_15625 [Thermodesulfobacteriota bacterium]